ncbi:autotransporter-associated N-terminal domain-containing protein [Fusobacterium polymorphum]|uniref:autotransporter-associated N-terminal domain-containing protein n=2 Tax=Fusobacterium nucleatum subsp. polymorphum TaxID=76857 RepID=UPI001C6E3368|nr:autotransporter-associated N-terminal domain-containing protein [Fusobacterium polymorphum]QYR59886.1 autotransporter-associated N-terminal domain-containing protein [Fusobacterium polymorphum]
MSNNLYKVEKDLRSIAKRYKSIKYSVGLAILFLMLGTGAFSEEINNVQASEIPTREEIASSRENLKNSVGSLQAKIDQARAENEKGLAGLRLELIQLMEQGDQVVKSPWSSWQFGANYMYSKWNGTYKGRGDKAQKYPFEGVFTRSNDPFERYTSPESSNYGLLSTSANPYSATTSSRNGLSSGYGIASTTPKQEPLTVMNVDASIRPKDVYRDPVAAPTVNVSAPVLQALNVPNLLPPSLDIPTPQAIVAPDKTPNIVINPTVQYNFDGRSITGEDAWGASRPAKNQDGLGLNYWSGWNPSTNSLDEHSQWYRTGNTLAAVQGRVPNLFYLNAVDRNALTGIRWTFKNVSADVAGNPGWNPKGTSAMHTVWDGDITNVNVRLHGYATFIAAETWHNGNVTINNSTVNIENEYNSVFFGYPGSYYTMGIDNVDYHSYNQRGGYSGNLKVNINANNNYIHSVMGVQGSFKLDNSGDYDIKGNGNLAYLGVGYTPNWQNLKGSGDVTSDPNTNMTPSIQLGLGTGKINVDGNSNVGLFFENRYSNFQTGGRLPFDVRGTFTADGWRPSVIGIYQGEIAVGMKVGENSASTGNVGVYSRSGQREGIVPETDLGTPTAAQRIEAKGYAESDASTRKPGHVSKGLPDYNLDKIHNLEIAKTEIYFGKHAVDSIMFAADKGSVIDVARPDKADKNLARTAYTEVTPSTEIRDAATDVTSSYDDTANKAATGTVIAYSTGVWNNTGMPGGTAAGLVNKPSEINLYKPVIMTGRAKLDASNKLNRSVALIGDNKGIVNAKEKVTALGYSSIVALAQDNGVVNAKGDIVAKDGAAAKDAATKPYLYNNIGAYAGANGTVNVTGNADIYGIGAMASGANAVANLNGSANTIRTGKSGALVATNGGRVNFGGGTITHSENEAKDHDSSTPFNADSSSRINFTGTTTLNISHGILIPGTKDDYAAAALTSPGITGTAKYTGMSNVTVNLTGDNVVLASNNGIHKIWDGTTIANLVQTAMKVAAFNANKHSYKIYYINGQFDIDSNIDVGNTSDDFNKVGLSREVVTINAGKTVSSTVGKGLAMGSNDSANADGNNSKTQYINNGTVDIKGGTLATGAIGLNISYGQIHNKNIINVENGIGAYGINGSTLTNEASGKINITTQGVGMAAFTSANPLQTYGTDKKITDGTLTATDKTFEIINRGQITVNGNKSVGLYGDTNGTSALLSASNGSITNSGKLTLTGDEAVGIVSKRATVNLNGTGSSDIVVGKKGIGVYAEKSPVTISSNYGVEVKDGGTGIFVKNDGSTLSSASNTFELKYSGTAAGTGVGLFYEGGTGANIINGTNVKLVDTVGTTEGLIGVYTAGGGKLTNNGKITGDKGYGIISNGAEIENTSDITFTNPLTSSKPSVGILTQAGDKITNTGVVTVGENSVGIFGKEILQKGIVTVGNGGTGLYSEGGNVTLDSTSKINTGANKAVGVFTKGAGQTVTASAGSTMTIGDSSFGFLNEGTGNTINSNVTNQTLGNDGTYIYSSDRTGVVNNNTALTSTGSYNYGLYSAGTVTNNADINFGTGLGNVGIYSTHGGTATNLAGRSVTVGASYIDPNDSLNNRYAVGMAAGFNGDGNPAKAYTGTVVNEGTINVNGQYSIGMYGTEAGTKVYNGTSKGSTATINLGASNTTGMYLDNGAYGYNYGTIRSTGTGLSKVVGVVVKNGSTIENWGKIELTAEDAVGILSKGNAAGANPGIIKNYGTFNINGVTDTNNSTVIKTDSGAQDLGKGMGGVQIDVPPGSTVGTIKVNGKPVVPTLSTTTAEEYKDMELSKIGMYIDTSNKRFTNPINGISALTGLKTADLIMGNEAAQNTTSKYIEVAQKVLAPYNEMIKKNPQIKKWNIYAGSLTWMSTVTQNQTDGTMQKAYLAKIPYTHWAGNQSTPVDSKDTYNFLDGLEQRYGVEGIGTKENQVFQKLNGIGKNEEILFFQAIDEMMGHQYANVQQRVQATGIILDKEFNYLRDEWRTASKDSNKIKTFGTNGEYKTDTAGVIDYKNNAYGVAYVHENEDIKLGRGIGWYTGIVHNTFKFKDIGRSKEHMLQVKVGLLKSVPFDDNNSLNWTISGDIFVGRNRMHRKFLVVDEVFNAKSKYYTYGIGVRNEIGKEFRLSEGFTLRPYAALKLEYGRVSKIREKSGEIKLEVKQNQYFSVRPEIGAELGFKHYFGMKALRTTLGVAYENELGRVANGKNKARVVDTTADWFNIRGEKEDRKGNVKVDLNVGVDNTRVGVTANVGYDTKGENLRGGLGLRIIF